MDEKSLDSVNGGVTVNEDSPPIEKKEKNIAVELIKKINFKELFTLRTLSILFAVFAFMVVGYYIVSPAKGEFHADCTDTIMWAQATYESGKAFDENFGYACLLTFGGHWLMVPLISVFGVSMETHVAGMFIYFLLFCGSLFGMLKTMKVSNEWALLSVSFTILMVSCSEKLREIFWGHIIYYSLGVLYSFIGLMLIFKIINMIEDKKSLKKIGIFALMLFVWCVLAGANQLEILTLFLLPALGAVVMERFFCFEKYSSKSEIFKNIALIGVIAVGTVAGYLLGGKLIGDIKAGYASGHSSLSATDTWAEHIDVLFPDIVHLLGSGNVDGIQLMSAEGIKALIIIVMAVWVIFAPLVLTLLFPKMKQRNLRIFVIFYWLVTALVMIGFICGKLSSANWRLSPVLCLAIVMNLVLAYFIAEHTDKKRLAIIALAPIICISMFTSSEILKMENDPMKSSRLYRISDFLQEKGLTYGYATFWNANSVTVITGEDVKVRSIDVNDEGEYIKRLYQSNEAWFEDQPNQEEYFLMLEEWEYEKLRNGKNEIFKQSYEQYEAENYTILVFKKNIF